MPQRYSHAVIFLLQDGTQILDLPHCICNSARDSAQPREKATEQTVKPLHNIVKEAGQEQIQGDNDKEPDDDTR
jgi:hypothetical protein